MKRAMFGLQSLAADVRLLLAVLALGLGLGATAQPVAGNEGVAFRGVDGVPLTAANSALPAAADAGWWNQSRGLAAGSRILLQVNKAHAPADGRSALRLDIGVFDAAGAPMLAPTKLLLETSLGRLRVPGVAEPAASPDVSPTAPGANPSSPPGSALTERASLEILTTSGKATVLLVAPTQPGDAHIRVSSGMVGVQGEVAFLPDLRPLLAVGVIEGALSLGKVQRDALTPAIGDTGFEERLRNWSKSSTDGERHLDGRAAFFIKGTIKGEYLLTAAADTDKDTRSKLFRDIDPNQFYPVYGDASVREFEARSRGGLFVRVDKDKSYALFGDFDSASDNPAQRLASYQRSMNGLRLHHESGSLRVNLFASRDRLRQIVDEQPGRGISGPYAVAQPNAVAHGEVVELLVRDRAQPALVLVRKPLTRYVDYDFEPFSGRLVFRQPVPSVDENLNPMSIRISYEVDNGGPSFWVGGADARLRVDEHVTLGAAYAQDDNGLAPYKLGGVNGELKLGERTYIVGEYAQSRGTNQYNQAVLATPGASATPGTPQSGEAARVELRHDGADLQVRAHAARAGAGFQNSQAGLAPGRQESGVHATQTITPALKLLGEFIDTQDRSGSASQGAARRAAGAGVQWTLNDFLRLDFGVRDVREHQVAGASGYLSPVDAQGAASSVVGLGLGTWSSFGFNGSGLLASPVTLAPTPSGSPGIVDRGYTSLRARLTGKVSSDFSLFGEHERADGDRQRSALGAEYRIVERSRAYARHEFANTLTDANGLTSDGSKTNTTVLGIDTAYMRDGQLFSEYRLAGSQNGRDAAAAVGVRNLWRLADGLAANTAVERQQVRPGSGGTLDATAVALGAEYTGNSKYRLGGKVEWRDSSVQDSLLASLGYDRKINDDWSTLVRALHMRQSGRGSGAGNDDHQGRYQLGLAYRDSQTNRWHGLARLEHRIDDKLRAASAGLASSREDTRTWIASLHANTKPSRAWTHTGQVAFKSVREELSQGTPTLSRWSGTLLAGRSIWDFAERWDASVYASVQQGNGTRLRGAGSEVGYRVMDNLWLSAGYTAGRYSDTELFSSNTSWKGAHLRLRFKFDEKLFSRDDGSARRTLDLSPGKTPP